MNNKKNFLIHETQNLGDKNFLVICTTTYGVLTTYQVS